MPPVPPLQHVDPETHLAVQRLRAVMPQAIEGVSSHRDQVTVRIVKDQWAAAAQFLRRLTRRLYDEKVFSVVLTPSFDSHHKNHLHLDGAPYTVDGT